MNDVFDNLLNIYKEKYSIPNELKINILISNDLYKDSSKFLEKYNRKTSNEGLEYNGVTCIPSKISETTMIFLSKELVENYNNNNFQFVCTFFHELTHAVDYYNYCLNYCNGDYNDFLNDPSIYSFKMWGEFNAKNISYLLYCQFVNGDLYSSEESLDHILKEELDFQNNYLINEIKKQDINEAIYLIIQYLGRYFVWENLFEDHFKNGKRFPKILKEAANPELLKLYNLLRNKTNEKSYYDELFKKINLLKGKIIKSDLC